MSLDFPYYPAARDSYNPPKAYAGYRRDAPVKKVRLWNGQHVWLVTRHADIIKVLSDHETFSQKPAPGYPTVSAGRGSQVTQEPATFLRMDPPDHTVRRRMITADFSVKRVNALRPRITEIANSLLDRMLAKVSPADLLADFAVGLPTTVITDYLGLPQEDHAFIHEKTETKFDMRLDGATNRQAQVDLHAYLHEQFRRRQAQPDQDDLMGKYLREFIRTGLLSTDEVVGIVELMVTAGHETTVNMIALGALLLMRNPDQMEILRNDRSLMASAVNEMLRHLAVNDKATGRLCVKDTEIAGQKIRAGEGVFASLTSGSRDESVFEDADKFDVTRNRPDHLAFGAGAHQCLGATLAKAEMDIAFNLLLDRLPALQLAVPFEQLQYKHDAVVFGLKALPVRW
ncbi:cytochrome P450 [Ramlibacter sp. 2FC]|uniref:cytochrome P450 n=1 Tax=Ramlibacter sp. 2FC TaxID=2502188 RepID=UPI00148573BF|nr:cytochrome P450 [Ramlibacter sp. 2FC]